MSQWEIEKKQHKEAIGKDGFFFQQAEHDAVGSLEDDPADRVNVKAIIQREESFEALCEFFNSDDY